MTKHPLHRPLLAGLMAALLGLAHADTTFVIIRHGEKPAAGLGQLSCKGLRRALALPPVLLRKFGTPTALYAPNPGALKEDHGVAYAYVRPLATIEPLAIQVGLPVQVHWGFRQTDQLAQELTHHTEGTFVIAWEHHLGEQLARALMAANHGDAATVPTWSNQDFDSLYVIRVTAPGTAAAQARFELDHQGLDGQPDSCPRP
jgi:hypothetical protein